MQDREFYIVKEEPLEILRKCRRHSKGTLFGFLAGICLLYLFMNWVPEILGIFIPQTNIDLLMHFENASVNKEMLEKLPGTPLVMLIYAFLLNGAFRLGECFYTLTYIRNKKVDCRAIFEGFAIYGKVFGLFLLQTIIIGFWAMFLIIPGIMAAVNFSQSFYILADDPSKGITQVLAESKLRMLGTRMTYLRVLIAFLPYYFAAYLPAMAVSYFVPADTFSTPVYTAIMMAVEIPIFAAYGMIDLGRCTFYELLINRGFENFRYAGQDAFRED
ncbi:MAG: hypothetical protein IJH95_06160 [Mogibacterium sp.]|nr:hypothetical protein [Mogibacterium sp.]